MGLYEPCGRVNRGFAPQEAVVIEALWILILGGMLFLAILLAILLLCRVLDRITFLVSELHEAQEQILKEVWGRQGPYGN